jgi:purine-binding chemotaxis protein CheW
MDEVGKDNKLVLGLLHIGPIELAVPTAHLREAVDYPPRLSQLLSASPHVVGAIDVRGDLVPVVDLRHALGLPKRGDKPGRIVIISQGEHLFGIAVDALGGVVITLPGSLSRQVDVLNPAHAQLTKRLFPQDGGKRIVNVLHLEGVMQLIDVPLSRAANTHVDGAASAAVQSWSPYVLFECAGVRLAIDAEVVDTVIDIDRANGGLSHSEGCIGLIQSGHRRMAVVDALAILGLGHTPVEGNNQVLVLKCEGNAVGIMISHVTQIARLNEGTRRPVPAMAFERPEFFEGMLPLEGHADFLCVSDTQFLSTTEVSSMASIHGRPADRNKASQVQAGHKKEGAAARAEVYLTFRIGQEFAAPLKQVREILPMPTSMTPIRRGGDPRIGLFTHRDQIVPIVDMANLLGTEGAARSSETRLLLIDAVGGVMAFMVDRVHAIETVQWSHDPIAQSQWRNADELEAALHARGLLTMGEGADKRGLSALDLPCIARALEARYTPAAAANNASMPVLDQVVAEPVTEPVSVPTSHLIEQADPAMHEEMLASA